MDTVIKEFLIHNWKRKLAAFLAAVVVWFFVNQSIIESKTIPNIPVRILNLPSNKTVIGLLPNGYLGDRVTLTLSGTKDIIESLEPGDLEIHLDANMNNLEEWVVDLSKKNLVSLDPSLNLEQHISKISHSKFVIKLSDLLTEQIPISIREPIGTPPAGYEFLNIWPQGLYQTLSGPSEEVRFLQQKGLKLILNLNNITTDELEKFASYNSPTRDDEIAYLVPKDWKQVAIPFHRYSSEDINDPKSEGMRIEFLKKQFHKIDRKVPVHIYYPVKHSSTLNPNNLSLALRNEVEEINGVKVFSPDLYVRDVSKLFLDLIRENIIIAIIAVPKEEREVLQWSVEVIDPKEMEDTFIAYRMSEFEGQSINPSHEAIKEREELLRKRFREYMHRLTLYTAPEERLHLNPVIEEDKIILTRFKK